MSLNKIWLISGLIFLFVVVGTSIAGGVLAYSPIPFWDMWDGELNFYLRVTDGEWTAWFGQHNDHRILLSRILFWLDLTFFGGKSWFLICINYLLVATNAFIFYRILCNIFSEKESKILKLCTWFFITAWLFQWMQYQNLIWAFQSQFFLVQTFSLASFYVLSRVVNPFEKDSGRYFFSACVLGFTSAWTMANGIVVLPLMFFFLLFCRQSLVRLSAIAILFILTCSLYFLGYQVPDQHSSALVVFLDDPVGIVKYASLYLGGPFYYLSGGRDFGRLLAYVFGFSLIPFILYFPYSFIRDRERKYSQLSLYLYIVFVVTTAFITAGGRLKFGVDQALESRYTTPALMAWAALLVLGISRLKIINISGVKSKVISLVIGAIACVMIVAQLQALKPRYEMLHERNLAALALAMEVHDQKRVSRVYPSLDKALEISQKAYTKNVSIFSSSPYTEFRERSTKVTIPKVGLPECAGFLDAVESVEGDPQNMFIKGWIFNQNYETYPNYLRFLNPGGKIVGYAITGSYRPDVAGQFGEKALLSGFDGYISSKAADSMLIAQAGNLSCEIRLMIPKTIFRSYKLPVSSLEGLVGVKSVINTNQWLGKDFYGSAAPRVRIYGSYITGDADMGSISIMVKRNQKIFYRSGPTAGRQLLEINGDNSSLIKMPALLDWTLLEFSGLPEKKEEIQLRFIDEGNSWGEWSAIGLREEK